ncbi:hypothetical protein FHS27_003727 [Rhodopirellula rubra]|uniref:Uncharacterized protein n=1 Tax=Aporhodopirellula rubra TaxID=980271 RepID=A0A7W5E0K1_9BACT|nr:hypothetical protein [Aporhodopirellula rubra]
MRRTVTRLTSTRLTQTIRKKWSNEESARGDAVLLSEAFGNPASSPVPEQGVWPET